MNLNKQTILIIAAHPDDEILGCGATMARLAEEGHDIHILILAEGLTSRQKIRDRSSKMEELSDLGGEARKAAQIIGAKSIELLDFPDNRLDSIDLLDIVKVLEEKIESVKPQCIFTHFYNDLNIDHKITNQAVVTATRPFPSQTVKTVFFFEVLSSTEWEYSVPNYFKPNIHFGLTLGQVEKKLKAMRCYEKEIRNFPHPRSIEAIEVLLKWRGSNVGTEFAEGFQIGRALL